MMLPRIQTLAEKKLIGMRMQMSLADNKTGLLWKAFMPRRKEVSNQLSSELISLQVYPPSYFQNFNPTAEFEKWAAVEVADVNSIPSGMDTLVIPSGLYAVFDYKGSSTDSRIFQYIYTTWLPASEYVLDNRPPFEVLGEKYKNNDASSEEEIWIPIIPKPGSRILAD